MVLKQFAVSISEGGSSSRFVPFFLPPVSLHLITATIQPWIKPSLFDNTGNDAIVDEWTFGQLQDYNVAQGVLVDHWNTWITEADFCAIADAGWVFVLRDVLRALKRVVQTQSRAHPNRVLGLRSWSRRTVYPRTTRLPSPGNRLGSEIQPQGYRRSPRCPWKSKRVGEGVGFNTNSLICYLSLPHRFDNSGHRLSYPQWHSNQTNVDRTNRILAQIAAELSNVTNVVPIIAPLNESVFRSALRISSH
jgi:glucan 1,3-beta-glucosidase